MIASIIVCTRRQRALPPCKARNYPSAFLAEIVFSCLGRNNTFNSCIINQIYLFYSEGLTNLIFKIGLPQHINPLDREPKQVLLRIFGQTLSSPIDSETPESLITGIYFVL